MTRTTAFSDEDLTAFLDGEADAELAHAIAEARETDAALIERLADLDISALALRDAFDAQLVLAPKMPDTFQNAPQPSNVTSMEKPARWRGFLPGLAVGIAASVATVMALGFNTSEPEERGWLDVVANYQMLYTAETLKTPYSSSEPSYPSGQYGDSQTDTLQQLSKVVDLDLTDFARIEGLTYKSAQQLAYKGTPLIQMAFALPDGTPVAICILQSTADSRAPRSQTLEGMAASDWTTGTHGVLVIGGDNQTLIDQITPRVQSLI